MTHDDVEVKPTLMRLVDFLKKEQITAVFTSLTAGRAVMGKNSVTGEQPERIGPARVWILPSPSPLADNHWDIAPWKALAKAVRS